MLNVVKRLDLGLYSNAYLVFKNDNMNYFKSIILSLGWVFFAVFLISGYVMNTFKSGNHSLFTPITWDEHLNVFDGALSCSLTSEALMDRIALLREEIFPKLKKKEELAEGFIYYFEDEGDLAVKILEFIGKEKQCCPFFKFDVSVLPFKKGIALKISGSKGVKEFLLSKELDLSSEQKIETTTLRE